MADITTSSTTLLPFQQKGLEDLYKRTVQQVDTGLPIYQGDRVAGLNAAQQQGLQAGKNYAQTGAPAAINTAIDANTFWSDPSRVFNLSSVPGYSDVRSGIENSVGRMLTEQYLPQIAQGSILNSGLSNNRIGIAQGQAAGRATEALTAGLGNLDLQTAQMLLQANQGAIARAPQLAAAGTIPADILLQYGGLEQGQAQAELDAKMQKFQEEANSPYFGLDQLRASLGSFPGGTGNTTTSEPGTPWWKTAGSLALLGKSLLS